MRFRTTILTAGKTTTGIQIPDKIVDGLGSGKRPPVCVTINGYTYRSTVAVMGGRYMVGVSAEVRDAAGVEGGDTVNVDLALDEGPRDLEVPREWRAALKKTKALANLFDALSFSNRKRLIAPIAAAKTTETRDRNIQKSLALLRSGELKPARKS